MMENKTNQRTSHAQRLGVRMPSESAVEAATNGRASSHPVPGEFSVLGPLKETAIVDVSVVVPTYCEALNLPALVPQIDAALQRAELAAEILIVDDNSPDDTVTIVSELAEQYPVRLIVRENERGLSSAVIHGMRQSRGEYLLVLDADLSHPPEVIPELILALTREETDFVIGSRYVEGGSTDEHWGLLRKLNSQLATLFARPFTSARDPMAGFFALRRSTFLQAAPLDPIGYKIGLELIVKCRCRNIREVPIYFQDRRHGESKLSFREQLNYLRHVGRLLRYKIIGHRQDAGV